MTNVSQILPPSLWESAVALQAYLDSNQFKFCFIGGIAVQRWGEPRVTEDIDLTVLAEFGAERSIIEPLLNRYQSRHPDPLSFATQARILLLSDALGNDIDLSIGGLPFEHRVHARSSVWGVPTTGSIRTCGAEDLVTLKAFASRPQDWIDVEKIIIRQNDRLDRRLILEELTVLADLKEEPEIVDYVNQLFAKHIS
ncbi:MAG: nucleotidyl transferase AbiEii/AbiGii toxin family protein [Rhodopirellula sp. JB053]|uniref:nucleotidyl transferase AbiEii/AbiGii toxin family protein n=1 Tax=Rhodopirellula sp. JB044 TaxID=3342844 RepID=UPI00370A08F1